MPLTAPAAGQACSQERDSDILQIFCLPSEIIGDFLEFLDGKTLTVFECVSRRSKILVEHEHRLLYKTLLLRELENVPQIKDLPRKDAKRALEVWSRGDFQPVSAFVASGSGPSGRYLHRMAAAGDGWYYLFGGNLADGMSGDVWRCRVTNSKARISTNLRLKWQQVDGDRAWQTRNRDGDNEDEEAEDANVDSEGSEPDEGDQENSSQAATLGDAAIFQDPRGVPPPARMQHLQALGQALAMVLPWGNEPHVAAAHVVAAPEDMSGRGNDNGDIVQLDVRERPCPRCAMSWTCPAGSKDIYLFGGLGSSNEYLDDLWCFHAGGHGANWWEKIEAVRDTGRSGGQVDGQDGQHATVPAGRWGHTMVEHEGVLYMFGGSSPARTYGELWRLEYSRRPCVWSLLRPTGDKPAERGGHSACVVRDTLYIFGGNTINDVFNDAWAIDLPACSAWRKVPQSTLFPPGSVGHSAIALGRRILIYGGRNFSTDQYTTGISCFDAESERFVNFGRAKFWNMERRRWHGLEMTGHSAVPCARGLIFVGGLMPGGVHTMKTWVLDVLQGRRAGNRSP